MNTPWVAGCVHSTAVYKLNLPDELQLLYCQLDILDQSPYKGEKEGGRGRERGERERERGGGREGEGERERGERGGRERG